MTASSLDTAEITRRTSSRHSPSGKRPALVDDGAPRPSARAPLSPARAELRAERLQARRHRRQLAGIGLGIIACTLGATVAVLDVVR